MGKLKISAGQVVALLLPLLLAGNALPQAGIPRPETVVKARALVSLEAVPRGSEFEIAVLGDILPGFHVNANQVLEEYLIPTTLAAELPPGFRLERTIYPQGVMRRFAFAEKEMAVYEKQFVIRMKLKAPAGAPLGTLQIPLALRYQACNETTCLPPVKISVPAAIRIAAADTRPKPVYPEIFKRNQAGTWRFSRPQR